MGTPFCDIYKVCLSKIKAYDLLIYDYETRDEMMYSYLLFSISKFKKVCNFDLTQRDLTAQAFLEELDETAVDILGNGMVVAWLKQKLLNSENLVNLLNTNDYSQYSPANLLDKVHSVYNTIYKEWKSEIIHYSYDIGNLSMRTTDDEVV